MRGAAALAAAALAATSLATAALAATAFATTEPASTKFTAALPAAALAVSTAVDERRPHLETARPDGGRTAQPRRHRTRLLEQRRTGHGWCLVRVRARAAAGRPVGGR